MVPSGSTCTTSEAGPRYAFTCNYKHLKNMRVELHAKRMECKAIHTTEKQMVTIYKGLVRPCMEYASHIWGGASLKSFYWREWSLKLSDVLAFLLSPPAFSSLNLTSLLLLCLFCIAIFMLTALRNLLTACLPLSRGLAKFSFLHLFTPILPKPLMQESPSIFINSPHSLVTSGTALLCLYFLLPMTAVI